MTDNNGLPTGFIEGPPGSPGLPGIPGKKVENVLQICTFTSFAGAGFQGPAAIPVTHPTVSRALIQAAGKVAHWSRPFLIPEERDAALRLRRKLLAER